MGYCERCGGRFDSGDWYDRCGRCGDDDEWTMNEPHDKEKVKCAHCGTEIYKVRRYCFICGAKNDAAFKKGDSYCPHCGNAFENGVCPNCGKSRSFFASREIAPIDSKYCAVCGEEVSRNDYFCMNCGSELYLKYLEKKPKEEVKCTFRHCQICGGDTYFDEDLFGYRCRHCGSDCEIGFFDPKNNKKRIKCKQCGHEMFEVRRFCRACGAKNEKAFKKGEYYCYNCGIALVDGICPDCGNRKNSAYIRSYSEKELCRCAVCGEKVLSRDKFCQKCGTAFYENPPIADFAKTEPVEKTTAKIPEHIKTETTKTTASGYSGYYFADLHTTLWLVLGIVSLVICCLPTGIGTIICSIGAKRAENELEYDIAKRKIKWAKFWFFLGCAIVASLMVASVVIQVSQM